MAEKRYKKLETAAELQRLMQWHYTGLRLPRLGTLYPLLGVGAVRDRVTIDPHQPHETVLLLLKRASDTPQLLTSTFHILQGAVEVKGVQALPEKLVVEMEKRGKQFGRLLFAVPPEQPVSKVLVNGRPQRPRRVAEGIWQAGFVLTDRATVELLLAGNIVADR